MIRLRLQATCEDPDCTGLAPPDAGPTIAEYWGDSPPLHGVYACPALPAGWARVLLFDDEGPVAGGSWVDMCPACLARRRAKGEAVPPEGAA